MRLFRVLALLLLLPSLAGCDLPRDPDGSLEQIRRGVLRVGVVHNPPWAVWTAVEPSGVEPALLRELAARLGARIDWVQGPEQELLKALEQGALHVVVGGFVDDNPWARQLGKTRPFHTTRLVVAARPQAPPLAELARAEVAAAPGSAASGYLLKKGAKPVDPYRGDWQYAALPDWSLTDGSLRPTEHVLREDKHVLLVAKGENGWLVTLERFLDERGLAILPLLRTHGRASP